MIHSYYLCCINLVGSSGIFGETLSKRIFLRSLVSFIRLISSNCSSSRRCFKSYNNFVRLRVPCNLFLNATFSS